MGEMGVSRGMAMTKETNRRNARAPKREYDTPHPRALRRQLKRKARVAAACEAQYRIRYPGGTRRSMRVPPVETGGLLWTLFVVVVLSLVAGTGVWTFAR